MAHHKQLKQIHSGLDKAKKSRNPERRKLYEHVENEHLAPAVQELRGKAQPESFLSSFRNIWEES